MGSTEFYAYATFEGQAARMAGDPEYSFDCLSNALTIDRNKVNGLTLYRVTVERITNADPEAVAESAWSCRWDIDKGFGAEDTGMVNPMRTITVSAHPKDGILAAWGEVLSATAPTYAEFAEAVKAATGVQLPAEEEPRWWQFTQGNGWSNSGPIYSGPWVRLGSDMSLISANVLATLSTRDSILDEMVQAVQKAAGKP